MALRNESHRRSRNSTRKTTPLSVEQLEQRLMNTVGDIESYLQLLDSPELYSSTPIVANAAPTVANSLRLNTNSEVRGRTVSASVLGRDDGGETGLKYHWSVLDAPSGGTVTFSSNGANSSKNNTLAFTRAGSYRIQVQIEDLQGLSTTSELQFNVAQVVTSLRARNGEDQLVSSGARATSTDTRYALTAIVLDQFGQEMISQPNVIWTNTNRPSGSTATVTSSGGRVQLAVSRVGAYTLKAQAGTLSFTTTVTFQQARARLQILSNNQPVSSPIQVLTNKASLSVRGFDQFGNTLSSLNNLTWTMVSSPEGSNATITPGAAKANFSFDRAGQYTFRATMGDLSSDVSFTVVPTLTKVIVTNSDSKVVTNNATISVTTASQQFQISQLDQFNQAIAQPAALAWSLVSGPTGARLGIDANGSGVSFSFDRAGKYTVQAKFGTQTFKLNFQVVATITSLQVTPGTLEVGYSAKQQFQVKAFDQFQKVISSRVVVSWSATGGTITNNGLFTAGTTGGTFLVKARAGNIETNVNVLVLNPNLSTSLTNRALANLVSTYYVDGQISRTEMIQILKSAGTDGVVDSSEYTDFQYIVSANSEFAMPTYVRELAKDVVGNNPANRMFKGQAAGNLGAGSSATLLNNLVDKWFLGADDPLISGGGLTYQVSTGNLFNGTPSRADTHQGMLGDCYFIAAVAAIADKNPDAVRNMFLDNGDGTYTVRFYVAGFVSGAGVADYVTVNRRLPTFSNGTLGYSGYGRSATSASTTLWIALAEKAYAQWNETGNSGRNGTNRYDAIEGGWMSHVNAQVLGYNSSNHAFGSSSKQTLIDALATNKSVTLGTQESPSAGGLVGAHAYIVTGYNSGSDTFTLHNPWGVSHPTPLTWTQLQANCSMFVVTNPQGGSPISVASVRSAVSDQLVGTWTIVLSIQSPNEDSMLMEKRTQDPRQEDSELQTPSFLASFDSDSFDRPSEDNPIAQEEELTKTEEEILAVLSETLIDLALSEGNIEDLFS